MIEVEETERLNTFTAKTENMNKDMKSRLSAGLLAVGIFLVMGGFYLLGVNRLVAGLILIGLGVFIIGVKYG